MTDFRVPRDTIEGKADGDVAWLVVERAYEGLETPYEPDPRLDELPAGLRAAYVLHWCSSELFNGGFDQLYDNSTGMLTPRAPEAARLIGAADVADIFERANGLFPGGEVPLDREERQEALEQVDHDALVELQDEFFALDDKEAEAHEVQKRVAAYAREHPDEFFTD